MKLVKAINDLKNEKPIWIMRQAGRYLPEYKELRKKSKNFMDFCLNKEMTVEATLQPIDRFSFDAAIIFSDILIIPHFLGQKVWFEEGLGPVLAEPNWNEILKNQLDDQVSVVYDSIKSVRKSLHNDKALIGFSGCPWTLASYMISSGKTLDFEKLVDFSKNWKKFDELLEVLVESVSRHSISQLLAGANVIQLFESWAFAVPAEYRKKWLFEPSQKIVQNIKNAIPKASIIYYGRGVSCDAITALDHLGIAFGISEDVDLSELPETKSCLQGNLDPKKLRDGNFKNDVLKILQFAENRPFIFNLGHGILPDTPLPHVEKFLQMLRNDC